MENKGGSSNNVNLSENKIFTAKPHQMSHLTYIGKTIGEYLLKLVLWLVDLVVSMFTSLWHFIKLVGVGIVKGIKKIYLFFVRKRHEFRFNDIYGRLSFVIFGISALAYHQYAFGVMYLLFEVGYIVLFVLFGANAIGLLGTLGTHTSYEDPNCDDFCELVVGDNSIMILIYGLIWCLSILLFLFIWNRSIKNGYTNYRIKNYVRFENMSKKVIPFGEKLDQESKEAYLNGVKLKDFKLSKKAEIDEVINASSDKEERNYLSYLFYNTITLSYEHNREIQKLEKKLANNKKKVTLNIEKEEAKLAKIISDCENKIKEAGSDEEKVDKLNVKIEVAKNNFNIKARNLSKKDDVLERKIYEKNKTYVDYVTLQNVRNNNRYGKFNNFYNVTGSLNTEILFYKNYKTFEDLYNNSLNKNVEANEANVQKGKELEEELKNKIAKTTEKFAAIREKKAKIEEEIKVVNERYNEEVKLAKNSENKEALLNEAKFKQVDAITKLRRQIKEYPSDKIIKAMEKEEIKEAKNAYSRDKKYIKTNFTSESYAEEQVVNMLLVDYKFTYKDALYFVKILTKDVKNADKKFLNEEEINEKVTSLNKELSDYEALHTDKFEGKSKSFKEAVASLFNENFHITILTLPVIGIICFTIIPLLFSILIAFTNYSVGHIPPTQLFTWSGLENFKNLFFPDANSVYAVLPEALMKTLGWTLLWAIIATFSNYILGIVVALLINKDGIRFKKFFRTIFVLTIAIPQFISLLSIGTLLKDSGAIGTWVFETFGTRLGFGTDSSEHGVMIAKIIIILVNVWVGIPYTILSTTGILLNIPKDLYESAKVDGAGTFTQFAKITMPYILFVTGPYLITQFVGNINNFNVIYFLTGGGPSYAGSALLGLGQTDLLITFLYKIITSTNNPQYGIASAVGIFIFVICSFISIVMYNKSGAIKEEDQFQ